MPREIYFNAGLNLSGDLEVDGNLDLEGIIIPFPTSNTLYVDETNHKVGIDQPNPTSNLHIGDGTAKVITRIESLAGSLYSGESGSQFNQQPTLFVKSSQNSNLAIGTEDSAGKLFLGVDTVKNPMMTFERASGTDDPSINVSSNVFFNNRVGINVSNPSEELEVSGNVLATSYFVGDTGSKVFRETNGDLKIEKSDDTNVLIGNVSSNTLIVDTVNNRVGIGTETPSQKLHVGDGTLTNVNMRVQNPVGDVYIGQSGSTRFGFTTGTAHINQAVSLPYAIGTQTGHLLAFGTDNFERMRITSTGEVGIGTENPSKELEVSGNVLATSYFVGDTGSKVFRETNGDLKIEKSDDTNVLIGNVSSNTLIVDTVNNRVGINRFPTEDLDISGNIQLNNSDTGKIVFYDDNVGHEHAEIVAEDDGTNGGQFKIKVKADGGSVGTALTIRQNGRVGIGSENPNTIFEIRDAADRINAVIFGGQNGKDMLKLVRNSTEGDPNTSILGEIGFNVKSSHPQMYFNEGSEKFALGIMNGDGDFRIASNVSIGSNVHDRLVIKQTGEVGVGNVAPDRALVIGSPANVSVDTTTHEILFDSNILIRQINSGGDRVAIGNQAGSSGQGNNAIAIGYNSSPINQGEESVSIGSESNAANTYSTALGYQSNATGDSSTALGRESSATGEDSTALGRGSIATGEKSTALGYRSNAANTYSTALGYDSSATGDSSTALGYDSIATGDDSVALGRGSIATGEKSTALGRQSSATGDNSTALGYNSSATNSSSTALGYDSNAAGSSSTALGRQSNATGSSSTALGYRSNAYQFSSTALGYNSSATNSSSTALGYDSNATGSSSTALGRQSNATGSSSIALGRESIATGSSSTALGRESIATGDSSMALGYQSNTFHDNTIVLNATSSSLNTEEEDALYIKPIKYGQDVTSVDEVSNVLSYDPGSGQVIHQYPQSTFLLATKFDSGETITKGDAVYIAGNQNDNVAQVSRAIATDQTKMPSVGIALETFGTNSVHPVVTFGKAKGINTSGFIDGETLYVSNTVVGGLSNVKPTGGIITANPDLIQNIGFVVKSDSNGTIKVTGVGRTNDIPNANVLSDDSTVQYVYVNTSGNDLKKIDPLLLTTAVDTLQQVTDTGNTTSNTVQFTNTDVSFVTSGNVVIGADTIPGNFTSNYEPKLFVDGGEIIARSSTADEAMISIGGDSDGAFIKSGKEDGSLTDRPLNFIIGTDTHVTITQNGVTHTNMGGLTGGSLRQIVVRRDNIIPASNDQVQMARNLSLGNRIHAVGGYDDTSATSGAGIAINAFGTTSSSGTSILGTFGDIQLFTSTANSGSLFVKRVSGSGAIDVILTITIHV